MAEKSNEELNFEGPNKEIVNQFACTACGADLKYKPGTKHLVCDHCGADNEIPDLGEPVNENDFYKFISDQAATTEKIVVSTVSCDACGATTTIDPKLKSSFCPYCATPLVIQNHHTDSIIQPKGMLPFKLTKEEAKNKFKKWLGGLWFAPNDLKKASHDTDRFNGIYIPYWTFDSQTNSGYMGQRGTYYYTTQTYTAVENGKSVTKTRQVRHTRWVTVSGHLGHFFDDVLIIASKSLPLKYAEALEPWDLANIQSFNESYLGGFITEKYQVELKEGFDRAKAKMDNEIRKMIRSDIGGDEQRILTVNTNHSGITFKHILLPVYLSSFRYKAKVYQFLVNGRTGEVQGQRPYSAFKIAMAVIAALIVIAVIIYFATRK